jgi:Caspase domain
VFYAGHGLQIDGENYLVPIDVDPRREADIPLQAVRLNDLMNTIGALPTRMRIFMLDACRNNPFPALAGATPHGLAMVDTKAGASGSFISYSTSPGSEAEDGNGDDSPYTTAVLQIAKEPNVPIEEAFKRIRVAVNRATDGRQTPWESSSLTSEFKFFGADGGQPPETTAKPSTPSTPAGAKPTADDWKRTLQGKDARVAYEMVVADDSVAAYDAYVGLFAQASLAPRVRSLLERRREMMAWANAVAVNTGAAFETFLASYGVSDLAATARKLEERVRNRTLATSALASLGPNCPAPTLPAIQPLKKTDNPPPTKKADKPAKTKPTKEAVEREPKQEQGPSPAAVMEGVGLGLAIGGGIAGGMGGRSGGMNSGGGMSTTGHRGN